MLRGIVTHRLRWSSCTAALVAGILAVGLWLPGAAPLVRERPLRRPARAGWSTRSLATGAWTLPERDVRTLGPGAGSGDRDDAPAFTAVVVSRFVLARAWSSAPGRRIRPIAPPGRPDLGVPPGRAPPVLSL